MSNNSSPSMSWFRGDEYNRVLAGTPPSQFEDSGYLTYQDSQINRTLSPVEHIHLDSSPDMFSPSTPDSPPYFFPANEIRNNSPSPGPSSRPIDLSQCGQRFVFSPRSPPVRRGPPVRYSEMTQSEDSRSSTYQESQVNRSLSPDQHINLDSSPAMLSPSIPGSYALNLIDAMEFSPSPPRQSQIDEWLRTTPLSQSMSNIVPPENDLLIFGRILNTSQPSQNENGWAEDGYNDILAIHMSANEDEWYNDGADEVLNHHMDAFEYH